MAKQLLKSVIMGTRSGYVIRWTCPECYTENVIVNRTPAEFYKASRDSTCRLCRKRSTISTTCFHN